MQTIASLDDAVALVGTELGVSEWLPIDQSRIDRFAEATDDHQWLHVDPARAADGPYGSTIAHGFLVLSLLPALAADVIKAEGFSAVVNYGLERVRFPSPVREGSRIRDRVSLDQAIEAKGGLLLTVTHTIEIEGSERPACVATQLRLLQS